MNKSIDDHIDAGEAVFKWVQHTPVEQLKTLEDSKLSELREALIKEARSVDRAPQWVDGIIKLKNIERHKTSNKNA